MGTRGALIQERLFGPVVEQTARDGLKPLMEIFHQSAMAENTAMLAGATDPRMADDRRRVLTSTLDAVMSMMTLPPRLDDRTIAEEVLRDFVNQYARADVRLRRFTTQLNTALVEVRREQLPDRPLDGVHLDDFVQVAVHLGQISVNDLLDKHHAAAALFVQAYVCDRAFSEVMRRAVRDLPRAATVFPRLAEAVDWLERNAAAR